MNLSASQDQDMKSNAKVSLNICVIYPYLIFVISFAVEIFYTENASFTKLNSRKNSVNRSNTLC